MGIVLSAESKLSLLQRLLIADVTPILVVVALVLVGSFASGILAIGALLLIVPRRFLAYIDGAVIALPLLFFIERTGLGDNVRDQFGGFASVPLVWFACILLTPTIWKHLPIGLRYTSQAKRTVHLSLCIVEPRLIPSEKNCELADIAWLDGDEAGPGEAAVWVQQLDDDIYLIREDYPGRCTPFREMRIELSSEDPHTTTFEITVKLGGISPFELWDFWSRPFAEDYCEHLAARPTGKKDRSTYGRLTAGLRRKHEKMRTRHQPA